MAQEAIPIQPGNWDHLMTWLQVSLNADGTAKAISASSDGSLKGVLGAKSTGWTHTGDTVEALLTSVAVPANAFPVGGQVEVLTTGSMTNNANNKNLRIRLGAANDLSGTALENFVYSGNATWRTYCSFLTRATNQQIVPVPSGVGGFGLGGTSTVAVVDTTAPTFLVFSGQCPTSGADSITLESYLIRIIPAV